jgi:hypothetical protein
VSAERALRQLNKKKILDRTLITEYAKDEAEKQTEKTRKRYGTGTWFVISFSS